MEQLFFCFCPSKVWPINDKIIPTRNNWLHALNISDIDCSSSTVIHHSIQFNAPYLTLVVFGVWFPKFLGVFSSIRIPYQNPCWKLKCSNPRQKMLYGADLLPRYGFKVELIIKFLTQNIVILFMQFLKYCMYISLCATRIAAWPYLILEVSTVQYCSYQQISICQNTVVLIVKSWWTGNGQYRKSLTS